MYQAQWMANEVTTSPAERGVELPTSRPPPNECREERHFAKLCAPDGCRLTCDEEIGVRNLKLARYGIHSFVRSRFQKRRSATDQSTVTKASATSVSVVGCVLPIHIIDRTERAVSRKQFGREAVPQPDLPLAL